MESQNLWSCISIFRNFRLGTVEKQGIQNLRRYRSKSYAFETLCDSEAVFQEERKGAAFCPFL